MKTNTTMKSGFLALVILGVAIGLSACNDEPDDPIIANESELITTVQYRLISENKADTLELTFRDTDGDGGMAPVITADTLKANTTYSGRIKLLDESGTEAEDITVEVSTESNKHQVFYEATPNSLDISYNPSNIDKNGNPVGITTILTTQSAFQGTLKITLRHEPDKFADGVSDGEIENAGGETDIEVQFPLVVE